MTAPALPQPPHSEENPHHMAIYLHGLTRALDHLYNDCAPDMHDKVGVSELLTLICERAEKLVRELEQVG